MFHVERQASLLFVSSSDSLTGFVSERFASDDVLPGLRAEAFFLLRFFAFSGTVTGSLTGLTGVFPPRWPLTLMRGMAQ